MNTTLSIANYFVIRGIEEKKPVTLMQLMKLVYFAHGWNLAINDTELISESFQAWKFGPVLRSLYHTAKFHGSNPIKQLLCDDSGYVIQPPELEENERKLMEAVWRHYGKMTAFQLSALTHEERSPWYQIFEERGGKNQPHTVIPNDLIKQYFQLKMPQQTA